MHNKYQKFIGNKQRRAGKVYEQHVSQTLKQAGWEVINSGESGVYDHGIDIIANKDGVKRYIQCKGWKPGKLIHEDVVEHLLGSVASIEGIDNLKGVEIFIYTSSDLDHYAERVANKLNIQVVKLSYPDDYLATSRYWRRHKKPY